ncbi:unnamed protein product [Lathyrus sativus]|nr:unnamed protein product [Lathyrus sativus]
MIIDVSRMGNASTKTDAISNLDYNILFSCNVKLNPSKYCIVKEFLWLWELNHHILNWVKCNIDGAAVEVLGVAVCGGIYGDYKGNHLGSFLMYIRVGNALMAELKAIIVAIEIVKDKN